MRPRNQLQKPQPDLSKSAFENGPVGNPPTGLFAYLPLFVGNGHRRVHFLAIVPISGDRVRANTCPF